jgi:hypothetical protein
VDRPAQVAAGARFAFNCYQHSAQLILCQKGKRGYQHSTQLILCQKGKRGYTLLSVEGVNQGDPLSMILYGLALVSLAFTLRQAHPELVHA